MKFKKSVLQLLADGFNVDDDFEVIQNELAVVLRWSTVHNMIFKYRGNFYRTSYRRGLAEMRNERPYEYQPEEVGCEQVWPHTKIVTEYLPKKPKFKPSINLTMTGDEYHAIN
jgi:hypothetical protein